MRGQLLGSKARAHGQAMARAHARANACVCRLAGLAACDTEQQVWRVLNGSMFQKERLF